MGNEEQVHHSFLFITSRSSNINKLQSLGVRLDTSGSASSGSASVSPSPPQATQLLQYFKPLFESLKTQSPSKQLDQRFVPRRAGPGPRVWKGRVISGTSVQKLGVLDPRYGPVWRHPFSELPLESMETVRGFSRVRVPPGQNLILTRSSPSAASWFQLLSLLRRPLGKYAFPPSRLQEGGRLSGTRSA